MSFYASYPFEGGGGGGGGSPTGPAGGDLSGTYPNPTVPLLHQIPNSFASFDNAGDLESAPGWNLDQNGQATANLVGTLPITSVTSLQVFPSIATPLSGGYEGIIVGPNLSSSMAFTSMFNSETQFSSGFSNSGGTGIYQDQNNFDSGAVAVTYYSYGSFPNINGDINNLTSFSTNPTVNSNNVQSYSALNGGGNITGTGFNGVSVVNVSAIFQSGYTNSGGTIAYSDSNQLLSGSSSNYYSSMQLNPSLAVGSTIGSVSGIQLGGAINGTIAGSYNGININPSSSSPIGGNVQGININLNNISDSNPQGVVGLSSDSRLSINATTQLRANQGFQIGNRIESLYHVPSGSPVTNTDSLGNNFAGDLSAEDSISDGPTAGLVGWSSVGFIASVGVAAGKTVDTANIFLPAGATPDPGYTTGGTITNFTHVRIPPLLPQGGTLNITNYYALKIDAGFSSESSNAWGIQQNDQGVKNRFFGSQEIQTHTVSTTYTVDSGSIKDYVIFANTSGAAFSITLPPPTAGREISFKDSTGSFLTKNLTVLPNAAETIDGAASLVLNLNYQSATLVSNGTNWFII